MNINNYNTSLSSYRIKNTNIEVWDLLLEIECVEDIEYHLFNSSISLSIGCEIINKVPMIVICSLPDYRINI